MSNDIECYSIIGVDNNNSIVTQYGNLYKNKNDVVLKIVKLQQEELEKLNDSLDANVYEDDATEERQECEKNIKDYFFDNSFGAKLYGLDYKPKYHLPIKFIILSHVLRDNIITQTTKGNDRNE